MDQEKQHDIALMRYSVISPVISGLPETYSSLEAFYRDASKKGTFAPDGTLKHFAPATIERWYRNYRSGGFDALIPQGRVDEGKPAIKLISLQPISSCRQSVTANWDRRCLWNLHADIPMRMTIFRNGLETGSFSTMMVPFGNC